MQHIWVICMCALINSAKLDDSPPSHDHLYAHEYWVENIKVLLSTTGQYDEQHKRGSQILHNETMSFNMSMNVSNLQLYDLMWNLSSNATLGPLVQQAALGMVNLVRLNLVSLLVPVQEIVVGLNATGQAASSQAVLTIQKSLKNALATLQTELNNFARLQLALGMSQETTAGLNATIVNFTLSTKTFSSQLADVKIPSVPTPLVSLLCNATLSNLEYLLGNLTLAVQRTPEAATNVTNGLQNPFFKFNTFFSGSFSTSEQSSLQVIVDNLPNLVSLATESFQISTSSYVSSVTSMSLNVVVAVAGQVELSMATLRQKVTDTRNPIVIALLPPINRIVGRLTTEVTTLTSSVRYGLIFFYSSASNVFARASKNLSGLYVNFLSQLTLLPASGCFNQNKSRCVNTSMNATWAVLQNTTNQFQMCYNQSQTLGNQVGVTLTNLASNMNNNLQNFDATIQRTNWNNMLSVVSSMQSVLTNLPNTNFNSKFQQDLTKCTTEQLHSVEVCVNRVQMSAKLALQRIQTEYNACVKA